MESLFERFIRNFREEINHRNILQWGEFLASMNSTAFEVQHTGALFKLYSLYSYLRFPYLHIMMSRRQKGQFPQKIVYLDLFSGIGLNKVNTEGRSYYICGSGILVLLASYLLSEKRRYTFVEMVSKRRYNVKTIQTMLNIEASEAELLLSRKSHRAEELGQYYLQKYKEAVKNTEIRRLHTGSMYRDIIIDIPIRTAQSSYTLLYATSYNGRKGFAKVARSVPRFCKMDRWYI